ncbi:FixH family protein [Sulfurospirillum arcachonense]|uniref:FixH family protein n=1 Tax=Sulfurospirillum arcachonense TaxID=57666 RepID=UPI00046AB602|nr:FixH family protein [Sulfurospirillum arcachonense]
MIKKERNYWPHAIVVVLILMVFACASVVKIAMDNPVQMDSFYLEKYQSVDNNINDIKKEQKLFDENYVLSYKTKKFKMGEPNKFLMSIENRDTKSLVKKAEIKLVVTRPETNEFNQEITIRNSKNGIFIFEGIKADKPGRWQILTKINIGNNHGFNKYEVYASK